MAKSKASAGPERVDSRSFNGARRGSVLRRHVAPTADSFFGAEFALVEFDHFPEPIWSTTKFLKKPSKADVYERLRADPAGSVAELVAMETEPLLRALAKVSGGQCTHHDGAMRWVGFARALDARGGSLALLALIERLQSDPAAAAFDAPAVVDGGEYHKSDFRYGPSVKGAEVLVMLRRGLARSWDFAAWPGEPTLAATFSADELARLKRALPGQDEAFSRRFAMPALSAAFSGTSREYNARCGLDEQHAMINGTGY